MLIYFKIKDDWKDSKIFSTVYISSKLSIENQVKKFEKLKKYFHEQSNGSVNEYTLEETKNESVKSYTFEIKLYDRTTNQERFEKFRDVEFIVKYAEPDIFMLEDLIGWNFINIFKLGECKSRRFTFEKDGVYKQYFIDCSGGLRRDYYFEKNGVTYDMSKGTVWKEEFKGNMYKFSQALKGKVLKIFHNEDKIEIVTESGKFSYNSDEYRKKVIITAISDEEYVECPYDKVKKEFYVQSVTREKATRNAWDATKRYCISTGESNESYWLRTNEVSAYVKVFNKQDGQCVLEVYTFEKEYLKNIRELDNKTYNTIKAVVDKCNETGDFSCFDKMYSFENIETFLKCTSDFMEIK